MTKEQPFFTEKAEVNKFLPPVWREFRKRLLETIPSRQEGLNIERVRQFMAGLGLPVKDFFLFAKEDFPSLVAMLREGGFSSTADQLEQKGSWGLFFPELNLAMVRRDAEMEKNNSPAFMESILIHELVHASSGYEDMVFEFNPKENSLAVHTPRVGFCLARNKPGWGWFLEEGLADMVRGMYIERYLPPENQSRLLIAEKYPANANFKEAAIAMVQKSSGYRFLLPLKYIFLVGEDKTDEPLAAVAAFGLELLCRKNKNLREVLLAARNDKERLREIPQLLNGLKKGLYVEIQNTAYQEKDFIRGLRHIIDGLYGGESPSF